MPKLPTNMIRRKGRPGFWFRRRHRGKLTVRYLGPDFETAKSRLRSLITDGPKMGATIAEIAEHWLRTDVPTRRGEMRWGELCRDQAADLDRQGFLVVHHQTKSGKVRQTRRRVHSPGWSAGGRASRGFIRTRCATRSPASGWNAPGAFPPSSRSSGTPQSSRRSGTPVSPMRRFSAWPSGSTGPV